MNFRNLPLYRIVIDLDDDSELGMTCVSMVDEPAIEHSFELFGAQPRLAFAIQDEEKHIVTGPAIIQDMPIYRRSVELGEYMVIFDNQAINDIMVKYSKQGLWNQVSFQHDGNPVDGVVMYEMYRKDSANGISPRGYEDVADGSLFVSYKVLDEGLWEQIKNDTSLSGFSIEILADLEPTNQTVDDGYGDGDYDTGIDDELEALLRELLGDDVEFDWLWSSQKKKFANEDIKKALSDAVENGLKVELGLGDRTVDGYPYTLMDNNGSTSVALWDGKDWNLVNLKSIKSVQPTTEKATADTWTKALGDPSYDWVEKKLDGAENVSPKAYYDEIEDSILNGRWVVINYDDEQENPALGARQCVVMERGWTIRNNRAVRVWEQYGDSRHPEDIAGWRTMLTHRIRSIRTVGWLDPLTVAPQGFRPRGAGEDRDGFVCDLRSPLT